MGSATRAEINGYLAGIDIGKPVACRMRTTKREDGKAASAIYSDVSGHVGGLGARNTALALRYLQSMK